MNRPRLALAATAIAVLTSLAACSAGLNFSQPAAGNRQSTDGLALPDPATIGNEPASAGACVFKSVDFPGGAGGTVHLPTPAGYIGTFQFSKNNAPKGTTFMAAGCDAANPPPVVAGSDIPEFLKAVGGTAVFYVEAKTFAHPVSFLASNTTDRIEGNFGMAATFPAAVIAAAGKRRFYVSGCEESACRLQPLVRSIGGVFGPLLIKGDSLSLNSQDPALAGLLAPANLTVTPGHTVIAFIYTSPYDPGVQYLRMSRR
jgi:hypothetical protein